MNSFDLNRFCRLPLPGGFLLVSMTEIAGSMLDPAGRPAVAKTVIIGKRLDISLNTGMDARQQSISIYHEILEGLTVGMDKPPESVENFLERDFEAAAVSGCS